MQPTQRLRAAGAALVLSAVVGLAAGCGDDAGTDGTDGTASEAVVVDITIADGAVEPSGDRVEVASGQPIDLVVTSDAAGSIHVHSDPEQEFEVVEGTQTFKLAIDRPGVVTVELHDPEAVIVQLEVR